MGFWAHTLLAITGAFLLYGAFLWADAYLTTKAAPRKEMFWCDRHGAINKAHVIQFVGVDSCPTCFHERLSDAERGRIG